MTSHEWGASVQMEATFAAVHVLLTALTAPVMAGGRYAMLLACVCVIAAPQYFGSYSMFQKCLL